MKEGWGPLCEFLEKKVPDVPFPHKNIQGQLANDLLNEHLFFIRAQREMKFAVICIGLLSSIGVYSLTKYGGYSFIVKHISNFIGLLFKTSCTSS